MTEIVVTRRALEDFKRIWRYIAMDNERAADRLLLALNVKIEGLRAFPEIGAACPEIRPTARRLIHGAYLVLYEFDRVVDVVEIVAVVEGMRDLATVFET